MPTLLRIAPELPVAVLGQAIAAYQSKLGFSLAMEMPSGGYAIVERDGVAIHLFETPAPRAPVAMHIFTDGLDELHRELVARGAHITQDIEQKPWGTRDFRVLDGAGNELKFTEAQPHG